MQIEEPGCDLAILPWLLYVALSLFEGKAYSISLPVGEVSLMVADSDLFFYPLSRISPPDYRFDLWKNYSLQVADLYLESAFFGDKVEKILFCANSLSFKSYEILGSTFLRLQSARFCRERYCILCSWRRRRKWIWKILSALRRYREFGDDYRVLFLTLAQRNCELSDLASEFVKLSRSFKNLMHLSSNSRYSLDFPFSYIRSYEVTRQILNDGSSRFHPHIHCLFFVPSDYFWNSDMYIEQNSEGERLGWVQRWKYALGTDYLPTAHIKAIHPENSEKAVYELSKYITKPQNLISTKAELLRPGANSEYLDYLTIGTKGLRSISVGGELRKAFRDFADNPDVVPLDQVEEENVKIDPDLIKINKNKCSFVEGFDILDFRWFKDIKLPGVNSYLLVNKQGEVVYGESS